MKITITTYTDNDVELLTRNYQVDDGDYLDTETIDELIDDSTDAEIKLCQECHGTTLQPITDSEGQDTGHTQQCSCMTRDDCDLEN